MRTSVVGRGERLVRANRRPTLAGHIVGLTIMVVGLGMFASGTVDLVDGGANTVVLLSVGLVMSVVGAVTWRLTMTPRQIRVLDVFKAVTVTWIVIAVAGAVPYVLTGHFVHWDDALFESVSGFTTTGATVTPDIEAMSRGLLFWRSLSQ